MNKIEREIAEIKQRPYARTLVREDDGSWFISIPEFPGCTSAGATVEEALVMIDDAMTGWLAVMLEDGEPIPSPAASTGYSGKTVVRFGKALHKLAAEAAQRDGVSLNHFITTQVARGVGITCNRELQPA
jgi:predicted RNase H-like HicB family nuclease